LYNSGTYLFNDCHPAEALAAVRQLDELAKWNESFFWARKIEQLGAIVNAEVGNIADAIVRNSNALRISLQADDAAGEVGSLCNSGVALIYGGLFQEAAYCLNKAVALADTQRVISASIALGGDGSHFQCVGLNNLAQCHYYMGDNQRALMAIARCLQLTPEPSDSVKATSRIVRGFTYVRIALEMGLIREARAQIDACLIYVSRAGARGHAMTSICQGLYEVYAGNIEIGIGTLERVLDQAGTNLSLKMDALLALARATEQIDQPGRALAYLERLIGQITHLRKSGVRALLENPNIDAAEAIVSEAADLFRFKLAHAKLTASDAERRAANAHLETLERLAITADLKEEASGGHGHRVGRLSSLFARELGWTKDACHALELAGRLHDIGKIGLPDRLMLKSEALRETERQFITAHTKIGAEILASGMGEPLRMAQEVARFHHEHWDGNGYPAKIAGSRIPIHARIIALADVFDALTHGRPYSQAWPIDRALEEISSRVGKQFDPEIGERFASFVRELQARHGDIDRYLGQSAQNTAFSQARQRIQALLREQPAPEVAESGMSVA
jgi:putative two-component system response regulator